MVCRYCALTACLIAPLGVGAEPRLDFPFPPLPPPVQGLLRTPYPPPHRPPHACTARPPGSPAAGLPAEVADAVAQVESAYNPNAVGTGPRRGRPDGSAHDHSGHAGLQRHHCRPTRAKHAHLVWCPLPRRGLEARERRSRRGAMKYRAGHGEACSGFRNGRPSTAVGHARTLPRSAHRWRQLPSPA